MKKLLFLAAMALLFVACQENSTISNSDLIGRTYYSILTGDMSDTEFYLEFGKPYSTMVTYWDRVIWHVEHDAEHVIHPQKWAYSIKGDVLIFTEIGQDNNQIYTASYRNDSIFFMGIAYHRLLE